MLLSSRCSKLSDLPLMQLSALLCRDEHWWKLFLQPQFAALLLVAGSLWLLAEQKKRILPEEDRSRRLPLHPKGWGLGFGIGET